MLKTYTLHGRRFRAHPGCRDGFKEDRAHGLIYGPNLYTDAGKTYVAQDREAWSRIVDCCAYCSER